MKKKIALSVALAMCLSLFAGCSTTETQTTAPTENQQNPTENVINGENNTQSIPNHDGSLYDISLDDDDADASYNEQSAAKISLKGTGADITGSGASADSSIVTISSGGTYIITGSLTDGQIIVDNEAKNDIHLVLNNIDITCSNSAAIFIKQAGDTKITLIGENKLADKGEYVLDAEEEPSAVLFSKDDLVINGEGSLIVNANYNDGITSKDDLKILNANITINAKDDGIVGKDSLAVKDADFTITAGGHGFKSSNDTDEDKGIIHIESGSFGFDTTGDCFHAVTAIQVLGGEFELNSEDDGFHSDASVMLNGGIINIESCFEGIEGRDVFINDGVIYITASDDAVNAASDTTGTVSTTSSQQGGFGGRGFMMGESGNTLTVNGGYVFIKANGDGIDINGTSYIKGGTVIVNGLTNGGNASLDYDQEFVVTGGTIITAGSSQMAQVPSTGSTIYTVAGRLSGESGSVIHIEDESGKNIVTFAPCVAFDFFSVTSPEFAKDGKYYYNIGGTVRGDSLDGLYNNPEYTPNAEMTEFTMTDVVTYIGEGGENGFTGGFGHGGFGKGGKGDRVPGGNMQKPDGEVPQLPDGETPMKPQGGMPFEKDDRMPGGMPEIPQPSTSAQ